MSLLSTLELYKRGKNIWQALWETLIVTLHLELKNRREQAAIHQGVGIDPPSEIPFRDGADAQHMQYSNNT